MAGSSELLILCADLTTLHRTAAISARDTARQNTVDAALIEIGEYFGVNGKPDVNPQEPEASDISVPLI